MAQLLDGKKLAASMQAEMQSEVAKIKEKDGIVPGLVVILVGEDPASQIYVRNKEVAAGKMGIRSKVDRRPDTITEADLLALIETYNQDKQFHGILVQLPLPAHIDEEKVILAIDPKKDVDGFHPLNIGRLFAGDPVMIPCTPYGIMKLLAAYNISVAGKNAVVIGRSNIVGKPMAHLLLQENATVTIAHSKTQNLPAIAKKADILVAAVGVGHLVDKNYVKEGAVVIDVGMNRDANNKLIGDVDFAAVEPIADFITPVPGGVGPMTITMLLYQTIKAYHLQKSGV
ncbi:bifunctional methylenetetrahydrofolate dehydrogenase/methenyltetrahydrofolate cyclohydrolase [Enterococcus dispar]|uniref:bifunctional methylenetetrahydrofolate dehydrogenase/methenyltetrahydrofolate cyclohydrolase n=1 Tax=Enterococcus dispar TaxID=44009 RepID=UPI0021D42F16|nr:bifunctional methylenetetrahydrofolate dehydrogenase/methenyltetrahydrofolate cyclohydrolase [Enterococcus dispar]MCU7356490.1 bifunctional methylenetetrahydrofolate dehydrogenase/methenyltetrahydrofolate cyclohydrolase [Enterococcus dispar]WCG33774.1 bifunctional methylenetetrahydrofolate dehydrogenase/methenyltetrahydrofolate cyclohydrolase [Enterococcus dispar]